MAHNMQPLTPGSYSAFVVCTVREKTKHTGELILKAVRAWPTPFLNSQAVAIVILSSIVRLP